MERLNPDESARDEAAEPIPVYQRLTDEFSLNAVEQESAGRDKLVVSLHWDYAAGPQPTLPSYTAYIHLANQQSERLAGSDVLLGLQSVEAVDVHSFISRHEIAIPASLAAGRYGLVVGLYRWENGQIVNTGSVALPDSVSLP